MSIMADFQENGDALLGTTFNFVEHTATLSSMVALDVLLLDDLLNPSSGKKSTWEVMDCALNDVVLHATSSDSAL